MKSRRQAVMSLAFFILLQSSVINAANLYAFDRQHLRASTTQSVSAMNATDVDHVQLDQLAKDDFVRKCTVALSVDQKSLQPVDVIEKFCATTDATVECRLELANDLKGIYQRGAESVQIQRFCGSAYEWFLKKYGMFCPAQCQKFQCKATCMWLDDKKKLDAAAEQLKKEEKKADEDKGALRKAQDVLEETRKEALAANRSVEQAATDVERAETAFNEKVEAFAWQRNRTDTAKEQVADLKAQQKNLTDGISAKMNEQTQHQYATDKVKLNASFADKDLHSVKEKISEKEASINEQVGKLNETDKNMKQLLDKVQEEETKEQELNAQVETATNEVADRLAKVNTAEEELARVSDSENSDVVGPAEDLVRQQKEAHKEAEDALWELNRTRTNVQIDIRHLRKQFHDLGLELDEINAAISAEQAQVQGLEGDLATAEANNEQYEERVESMETEAERLNAELAHLQTESEKVGKTLELSLQYEQEEQAKSAQSQGERDQAGSMLNLAEKDLASKREEASNMNSKLNTAAEQVSVEEKRLDVLHAGLRARMEEHLEASQQLERKKPDIVRIHGLGFIQHLGY